MSTTSTIPFPFPVATHGKFWKNGDTDDYIRKEILDRIAPAESKHQSWTDCKGVFWSIENARLAPVVEPRLVSFHGEKIVVLLVKPTKPNEEFIVVRTGTGGVSESLPHRKVGDVGEVMRLSRFSEIQKFKAGRNPGSDRYACLFGQAAPTLFICHSSKDEHAADQFRQYLEANGITCWFAPNDIPGGHRWADSIDDAIDSSTALLVLVSRHSLNSQWVKAEVTRAFNAQKRIIPVQIDSVPVDKGGMRLILSSYQIIDATKSEKEAANKVLATIQNRFPVNMPVEPSRIPQPPAKTNDPACYRFRAEINGYFVRVVSADLAALTAIGEEYEKAQAFEIIRNDVLQVAKQRKIRVRMLR